MIINSLSDLTPGVREHELAATVALLRSGAVERRSVSALVDEVGSAVELIQLTEDHRLFATPDASHDIVGMVKSEDVRRALADVQRWASRALDIRSVLDVEYPTELRDIFNRPPLLFISGTWPAMQTSPGIAVVGARRASPQGLVTARRFAAELSAAGFSILSGLAAGIDAAAHAATLDAGGLTAAVMGTGLDRVFPAENADLAKRIVGSGGALISQFFPEQPPTKWTFPMRNVVMSGLAMATVVIEAGETSGARIQARVALEHGRTVFLLRSLVESHQWAHAFATDGAFGTRAIVIREPSEIMDRLHVGEVAHRLAVA